MPGYAGKPYYDSEIQHLSVHYRTVFLSSIANSLLETVSEERNFLSISFEPQASLKDAIILSVHCYLHSLGFVSALWPITF